MSDQQRTIDGVFVTTGMSREVVDELTVEVYPIEGDDPDYVCVTIHHGGQAHPFMLDADEARGVGNAILGAAAEIAGD